MDSSFVTNPNKGRSCLWNWDKRHKTVKNADQVEINGKSLTICDKILNSMIDEDGTSHGLANTNYSILCIGGELKG